MKNKKILLVLFGLLFFLSFFFVKKTFSQYYSCNQNCSGNPNGCTSPLTCSGGVCRNPNCLSQTNCICPTNTPTPTRTPTPTPNPAWTKLKNASFSSAKNLDNRIPATVTAYDADDNTQRYFIIASTNYDPGVVTANSINLNGAQPSSKNWQATTTKTTSMSPSDFLGYVRSRKDFNAIESINEIASQNYNNQILVAEGGATVGINDANKTDFDNRNLVLVVEGDLNIDTTTFTPANASVAFIVTGTITFSNTTTQANGIFVAQTINLGTTTNQGIKIVGNLSALGNLITGRKWSTTSKPAVFIVFDQNQYTSLLPLLSITNYHWQQLR